MNNIMKMLCFSVILFCNSVAGTSFLPSREDISKMSYYRYEHPLSTKSMDLLNRKSSDLPFPEALKNNISIFPQNEPGSEVRRRDFRYGLFDFMYGDEMATLVPVFEQSSFAKALHLRPRANDAKSFMLISNRMYGVGVRIFLNLDSIAVEKIQEVFRAAK